MSAFEGRTWPDAVRHWTAAGGRMNVREAGLTAGLQAIGIPSSVAISTALAFRLVTFYVPPLWGSFAMRWLRTHSYV